MKIRRPILRALRSAAILSAFCSMLLLTSCQPKSNPLPEATVPVIPVSKPVEREVTDFADYTGRTDAVVNVSVRARVTGFLMKMPFEEGAEVTKGDLLFEIDPRPYQALVDQAASQVILNQAQLKLVKATYERDKELLASSAVSAQQLDQDKAAVDEAEARIKVSQASLDTAKLNLSFCQVRAEVSGRVSRYYYTLGNLITQDQTLLTTIVSMDPIYAYFDVEQRTFQKIGGNAKAKAAAAPEKAPAPKPADGPAPVAKAPEKKPQPVYMALEGEEGFPHAGVVNFMNNQVNPSTGTVAFRGVFRNAGTETGEWQLIPGMFVRIRLPVGEGHRAQLVIDRAINSDQGQKFVYVLDAENKVQYRAVKVGSLQPDGLRVIEEGLTADDRVVVSSLQTIKANLQVEPSLIPMPTMEKGTLPSRDKPQPPAAGKKKS